MESILWEKVEKKADYLWWQKQNLFYTSSGYGRKIPTTWKVLLPFGPKVWRRVYQTIFSNSGTTYVVYKGERLVIW